MLGRRCRSIVPEMPTSITTFMGSPLGVRVLGRGRVWDASAGGGRVPPFRLSARIGPSGGLGLDEVLDSAGQVGQVAVCAHGGAEGDLVDVEPELVGALHAH